MSVDMYVSASQSQASDVSRMCREQITAFEQLQQDILNFTVLSPLLTGAAYTAAKAHFTTVISPLIKGAALLAEIVEEAVKKFPKEYIANVDSGDLQQSVLEEKIQETENLIVQAEDIRSQLLLNEEPSNFQLSFNSSIITLYQDIKRNLEEKLQRLLEFNVASSAIFEQIASLQQAVKKGLSVSASAWSAGTGMFIVPPAADMAWQKIISDAYYMKIVRKKYEDYLVEFPDDLDKLIEIVKFEELNPKSVKTTDKFLSPLELRDQVEIKYIIYTAEEPYRNLCLRYMEQFEIVNITESGVFKSGDNTLTFNVTDDRTNPRGVYYTFFHEIGHAIDYYYAEEKRNIFENIFDGSFFSDNFKYDGMTLAEYNQSDVANGFKGFLQDVLNGADYEELTAKEKQTIIDNINNNLLNQNNNYESLSQTEREIQRLLRLDYVNNKFAGAENESASDVYGGVTNLTIDSISNYGHHDDDNDIATGTYWYEGDGDLIRNTNKESFAEYYGRQMVGDPEHTDGLNSMDTYLPKSKECLEHMIKEMEGKD